MYLYCLISRSIKPSFLISTRFVQELGEFLNGGHYWVLVFSKTLLYLQNSLQNWEKKGRTKKIRTVLYFCLSLKISARFCVCVLHYNWWKFWGGNCSFMCPVIIRLWTANRRHQSALFYLLNKLILRGNCQSCYFLALFHNASASRFPATHVVQLQKPRPDARAQANVRIKLYGSFCRHCGFRLLHFVWQISWGIKSSSLADPRMRECLCQRHWAAAEISILVEQQPGEGRAQLPANRLLSGGEDSLFGMVTSADKCENAESLKHFYHGDIQSIWQNCFFPHFLSKLHLQTAFFVFRWGVLVTYATKFFTIMAAKQPLKWNTILCSHVYLTLFSIWKICMVEITLSSLKRLDNNFRYKFSM